MKATVKNVQDLAEQVDSSLFPDTEFNIVVDFCYEDTCIVGERPFGTTARWTRFTGTQKEAMMWLKGALWALGYARKRADEEA